MSSVNFNGSESNSYFPQEGRKADRQKEESSEETPPSYAHYCIIAALFSRPKLCSQPWCLCINKINLAYIQNGFSLIHPGEKMEKFYLQQKWIELEDIVLSETSQTQNGETIILSLTGGNQNKLKKNLENEYVNLNAK